MNKYEISGYYFAGTMRRHFCEVVEAPDEITAMKIVLGGILMNNARSSDLPIRLDCIHYECL